MSLQDKRSLRLKKPSFWLLLIAILLCFLAIFSLMTNPNQTKIHDKNSFDKTIPDTSYVQATLPQDEDEDDSGQVPSSEPGQAEFYKERIATWLEAEARATYEPYYEVLDFTISDYREENISDGTGERTEAIFLYTMISKNYDRDPDTVGYIIEAKENNSPYYQQMYDEYLAPSESNFEFKVIIDANDQMTLYSNISPKGTQWEETIFDDYIMK